VTASGHRIIIADDHPLFRDALHHALSDALDDLVVDEAGTLEETVAFLSAGDDYDLVLLDLKMPGIQGFSGLMYLRAQYASVPVVIVSAAEEPQTMRTAIEFGASGFIPKSAAIPQLREAVSSVLAGDIWTPPGLDLAAGADDELSDLAARLSTLTPQQVRVLMMLSEGLLNKQIAYKLSVSEATVKAHVSAILQKLDVDSRTQAVILAGRLDGAQWRPATDNGAAAAPDA